MKRSTLALLGLLLATPAFATTYDDVVALLAAQTPAADVVTAIQASKATYMPRHVYGLIDQEAPPEVIKAVAAKAAIFYDPASMQSLDAQAAPIRAAVPATALTVASPQDFTKMLEHYVALKKELDAAKAKVAPPAPRADGEMEAAYDKRVRAHQEELARALAPIEGKITNTKVTVELPATFEPYDGAMKCFPKTSVEVDLSAVAFETWRSGQGGVKSPLTVTVGKESKTVEKIEFVTEGAKRTFRAQSKPVCVYPDEAPTFVSHGAKLVLEMTRTHRGEDWTGTAKFVDAKTGDTLHVKSK